MTVGSMASDAAQMMKYVVCIASRGGGAVARQSIWKSHTSARKDRLSSSSSSAACTARGSARECAEGEVDAGYADAGLGEAG